MLLYVGVPYVLMLLFVLAVAELLPRRWWPVRVGIAAIGLALPWAVSIGALA